MKKIAKPKISGNTKKHIHNMSNWLSLYLVRMGYHINFRRESYKELDRFFEEYSESMLFKDNDAYVFAIAGYIGEVLRRVYRGRWYYTKSISYENLGERDIFIKLKNNEIIYPIEIVALRRQNKILIDDIVK